MADFEYYYENNEANFGEPLSREVKKGTHLTFECILVKDDQFFILRRPNGFHGATKNNLYFPHGLIRFGETSFECINRLCLEQALCDVNNVQAYKLSSWVDDNNHWHLCFNYICFINSIPKISSEVSEVVKFDDSNIPSDIEWWSKDEMLKISKFVKENKITIY